MYNYCERYKAEHKKSKPSYLGAGFTYCPVWLPRACFDCVNALGLNVSMAAKEADDVVVKLACQYEALVLSEDSDNFCCEIPKGALLAASVFHFVRSFIAYSFCVLLKCYYHVASVVILDEQDICHCGIFGLSFAGISAKRAVRQNSWL